ncbi:hypothetical protein N9L26_00065 [Candidatus Pacebacteria bacterium]|nr:hypothetical protein [Candidatus Paceibacterota bacterium]
MSYRVWLTKAAETDFTTATERKSGEDQEITRFQGLEVVTDKLTDKRFLSVNLDPIDPTIEPPTFPKGSVRKITFTSKHFDGFRNDGIYRHKGAVALLETTQKLHTPSTMADKTLLQVFQEVKISAGSVRTLREVYTKVRAGKLEPTEDWGSPMKAPSFKEMLGLLALAGAHARGGAQTPTDMN